MDAIYVINWQETHTCCGSIVDMPSGVYRNYFTNKKDARKTIEKLCENIAKTQFSNKDSEEDCYIDKGTPNYGSVHCYDTTYEYWIKKLTKVSK